MARSWYLPLGWVGQGGSQPLPSISPCSLQRPQSRGKGRHSASLLVFLDYFRAVSGPLPKALDSLQLPGSSCHTTHERQGPFAPRQCRSSLGPNWVLGTQNGEEKGETEDRNARAWEPKGMASRRAREWEGAHILAPCPVRTD